MPRLAVPTEHDAITLVNITSRGFTSMLDVPIIDSHVHLYDPSVVRYSWMDDVAVLDGPHLPRDLTGEAGSCRIDGMVAVEVGADPDQQLPEAQWVARQARAEPQVRAIIASAPLEQGAAVAPLLRALQAVVPVRGVRRLLQDEPDPAFCLRDGFVEGVQLLPRLGLSFDLCVYHPQLPGAVELVRRCPEVRFVLDHIGKPGIKAGLLDPWREQVRALAALPNVWCKISGVATEADHAHWTAEQLLPYVRHAVNVFGFDRIMFGGDWPVLKRAGNYPDWVGVVLAAVAGCSPGERRKLFHDNAMVCYRL